MNVIARYDLATCLREGQYTKAVDLLVEERDDAVSDEDWDRYAIDFALRRLERKREAIREFAHVVPAFPAIEPVLLVCARDTAHAEEIGAWLRDGRGISSDEILITHSERARTEEDIRRLVGIDRPGNRIRVVVNVFQLTEGWDVTNVYVIAPLRAMATFRSAIQTMGRGLRLPMGRRTGNPDVDTLDVLCCGRESFEDIVRQAIEQFGTDEGGIGIEGIDVKPRLDLDYETPVPKKEVTIAAVRTVEIPVPRVTPRYEEPPLDFEIRSLGALTRGGATALHLSTLERTGLDEGVRYSLDDFIASVHARVLVDLPYLSEPLHGEALDDLVRRFLEAMGARADRPIKADPMRVAVVVAEEIDRRHRQRSVPLEFSSVVHGRPRRLRLEGTGELFGTDGPGAGRGMGARVKLFRIPVRGWRKCVHEAAAFESRGEYATACLIDEAATVDWWLRNDPAQFRIPTPIGNFGPDFVYFVDRGGQPAYGILEVKSEVFWDGPGSEARVKADVACEWVQTVNAAGVTVPWEFAIVLDQDAILVASLEELREVALLRYPDAAEPVQPAR